MRLGETFGHHKKQKTFSPNRTGRVIRIYIISDSSCPVLIEIIYEVVLNRIVLKSTIIK